MFAVDALHLDHLSHPIPTFTVVASGVAMLGIWAFLILEAVRIKAMRAEGPGSTAKRNAVMSALLVSVVLGGVAFMGYNSLVTVQRAQLTALGHGVCHSWKFGSMLPTEPYTATIVAHYVGVAEYTCADASEHFVDLASGKSVPEPIGFFAPVGSVATQ
jgi:hypothetical protein